jgi:tetratricopeptide (TPR) repeat protein
MSNQQTPLIASQLPPFVAFLRQAAKASYDDRPEERSTWLKAAGHLHSIDDASLENLVHSLLAQSALTEALAVAEAWSQLHPDRASASFLFGYVLQMAGRHADALVPYSQAISCDPDHPQLRNNLAAAIRLSGGDLIEALALLEQAVETDPHDSNAWINLTSARCAAFDLDGALAAGLRAVELAPSNALACNNYSLVLKEAGRRSDAEAYALAATELAPDEAAYRHNLSLLHLARGNYAQGCREYESRWAGSYELRDHLPALPGTQWNGEPLEGKTLLVWGEQGMGDLLQFSRLIPLLAERVHRENGWIEWNSSPQMGGLLERSLGEHVDGFTSGGGIESLPRFDYHLPLLSAPLALELREETIPAAPYLRADPELIARWKQRLAGETRLKVGLAWTGSLTHQRNPFRRVALELFARTLKDVDDVAFYSLQPGATHDVDTAWRAGFELMSYTDEFKTFDDTAAFTSTLDLVITVCTSVAHLSGALGRPTWVLLDVNPHWSWLLDRTDSPWYPTAKLYRQEQFGKWAPVLQRIKNDLARLAKDELRRANHDLRAIPRLGQPPIA